MMLIAVSIIRYATYIYRPRFAVKKTVERIFIIFRKPPVTTIIVACSAGHKTKFQLIFVRNTCLHQTVDCFAYRAISTQDQEPADALFFSQFAS